MVIARQTESRAVYLFPDLAVIERDNGFASSRFANFQDPRINLVDLYRACSVDTEFDSKYLMLTRAYDRHRFSVRYDTFEVTQNDRTPEDNNPEDGHILTFAYLYDIADNISFGAESLVVKTHHCGWEYYGLDPTMTEKQVQSTVRLRFGS